MLNFYEKFALGAIFDFLDFFKGSRLMTFFVKKLNLATLLSRTGRPCRDPAFHETIVITMPLGPAGFFKIIFSIEIGSFSICSTFLCAMFYIICLSLF